MAGTHRLAVIIAAVLAGRGALAGEAAPAARLADVVDPAARVEKVAGGFSFTEGPAWSPRGFLLFSDIPRNLILRLDGDAVTAWIEKSGGANGLIFDPRGRLYACQGGDRRVVRWEPGEGGKLGKMEVLADSYGGKKT